MEQSLVMSDLDVFQKRMSSGEIGKHKKIGRYQLNKMKGLFFDQTSLLIKEMTDALKEDHESI
jgi:hypothetical protein